MVRVSRDNSLEPFNLVKEEWEMLLFLCHLPGRVHKHRPFPKSK